MSWLGIQARPFRALLHAFLWLDLRNETYGQATRTTAGELIPPLYLVIGQFLATSCLASMALFMRTDAWFFALASLGVGFVLVFSALVVEFHEVVLDPADPEVVGHHPVHARTYALARLTNLAMYVALMTIAASIFPAIIGASLPDAPVWFLPAYLLAASMVSVATSAFVILLYTTLGAGGFLDQARGLLSWVQIIAIMVVFYGGQLMLRNADGSLEHLAARPPDWLFDVPLSWLAGAVSGGRGGASAEQLVGVSAGTLALLALAAVRLAGAWRDVSAGDGRSARASARGEFLAGTTARRPGDRTAAATDWLVRACLRRDSELSLRCWPAFGVALAGLVLGLATNQLASPVSIAGSRTVLTLALYVMVAGAVPVIYQNMRYSRDYSASWIFRTAPIVSASAVARGVRRAVWRTFFLPILVVVGVSVGWVWRAPADVIHYLCMLALVLEGSVQISSAKMLLEPPFARPMARGGASQQVSVAGLYTSVGAATVAGVQYALGPSFLAHVMLAFALGAGVVALAVWSRGEVARRLYLGAADE